MLVAVPYAHANNAYSSIYITITDALINTKQNNETEATQALAEFEDLWADVSSAQIKEKQSVDEALKAVKTAQTADERVVALTSLSKAVKKLEEAENPVDEVAEREEFNTKYRPYMEKFEQALASEDVEAVQVAYKQLDVKWNQYEQPIREQNVGMYGQIETQMAFIRIALASEEVNLSVVKSQYETFKSHIDSFLAGEEVAVASGEYSIQTLVDIIDDTLSLIDTAKFSEASSTLTEFIVTWPNVEMEVSTRNGSLYTKIENDIPILVSALTRDDVDVETITKDLQRFKTELQLLQNDNNYSFWDATLILLREGLEALLIILVLVSFLKRANQQQMAKWIYSGAAFGVALSVVAAFALSLFFNSLTVNTSREMLEGYIGLVAALMMIGVGVWLHNKSTVASWNTYLSKQLGSAISKQSVFAMAFISFLSVFREGAETIIFYAGIAPKMPTSQLVLGIALAIVILAVVAFILVKMTVRIPIHKFFFVATIMIYLLAFKIIGSSIHTLQLTDVLPTTVFHSLPVVSVIGFYPTLETMLGQAVLLGIWAFVSWRQHK